MERNTHRLKDFQSEFNPIIWAQKSQKSFCFIISALWVLYIWVSEMGEIHGKNELEN